ncbi:hypothetical protein P8625_11235 [Tenacibaculum tangerinum]|uniref:Uncharacterized protein n=1 Tax=Tenacibaculum tangerinum TaxID=3038772 RepID=A0ABY8L2S0_9FLAO|nr:hypothetical protein [Tenacibaculum tangerinum]WGH74658.1 hypothetical protein P8625_11235 [Tenacibaculum tangerinum]
MSKKPIKSNLFRFVTLRSPQLIEDKEMGFVSIPEEKKAQSLAFQSVTGVTTDAERKTALKGAYSTSTGFTPIASRFELKSMHPALYTFSSWLQRNKAVLSYASIEANLAGAQELTTDEEFVLWENLFYQTIDKQSVAVREALIQVLVANKFLKAFNVFTNSFSAGTEGEIVFTEENETAFVRLANASVIVPKEVIIAAQNEFSYTAPTVSKTSQDYMQAQLDVALAKDRIQLHEAALKDLEYAETVYRKAESLRYETALKAYDASIEQLQQEAVPEVQRIINEDGFSKELVVYPDLQLPKFEFESALEIDRDVATTSLSTETLNLLNTNSLSVYDTYNEIKPVLRDRIKKDYQFIYDTTPQETQKISVGDTTVTLSAMKGAQLYSYSGSIQSATLIDRFVISMGIHVGYSNAFVKSATYTLQDALGNTMTGSTVKRLASADNLLNLQFFSQGEVFTLGDHTFSGELTLNNGVTVQFSSSLYITGNSPSFEDRYFNPIELGDLERRGVYSGVATKTGDTSTGGTGEGATTEETTNTTETENTVLYGVSQLGIADFRRVEQEVCCYVPGEVSHIENIMAREYKERSTKVKELSEQTTERTSEKEVENLTDTTSTERNELQNEASSIVNSDHATSFGGNASITSKLGFGTLTAGTNFNSSSANSTSNSNLQAQTYAQEVTERALERVVQKISTKRSSRVLREYEENNTHGFDNRKGDKHVTGVYRWVDKIYKNKLINYGKRLMYEFALPEPAKFYIKSYFEKIENDDKTSEGLIIPKKPVHPEDLINGRVSNAREINESNYQRISSIYGANVNAPIESNIKIGRAFKKDDKDYTSTGFSSNEIKIPKDYAAYRGTVYWAITHKVKESTSLTIGLGDSLKKVVGDSSNKTADYDFSDKYVESVPFSYRAWEIHSGSFNVTIHCQRTDEAYQKWQNETYKAIMNAYHERLQEYNNFIANQNIGGEPSEKKKELSSQINRSIEKRELKRIAIQLMKHEGVETARDNYDGESSKDIAKNSKFQEHAETVKFFEQAFDWEIMAYTFYPYFYGAEDSWDANFEYNEGSDPIFQAFLQSGMARAVVPVRPGFEEMVNWYMKTGEIWYGQGMVTDMDNDLYVSIAEEMQTIEGEVEGTWETRVPTTLTVLQADSVVLNEGGLPCNPDCEGQGLFDVSTYKIGDGPDGVDYDIVGDTNNVA